ncbi:MAG: histidinol dehydrogenase [Actinobacteria bacterium]|nr:histidinol dehydrogenase [Actinomycetota bacterium]
MVPVVKIKEKIDKKIIEEIIPRSILRDKEAIALVEKIIDDVRERKDEALFEYTLKFDGADLRDKGLRVGEDEIGKAYGVVNKKFIPSIRKAKKNIISYHKKKLSKSWSYKKKGITLGQIIQPLSRVGIYVPGGQAAYPSSVLMNAIPPQVVGVEEIAMCVPPDLSGEINPYTLVAAGEMGLKEIYKVGGAQAIAALAYGAETIEKVDKISGPGNIYVTLAKKLVVGEVGIDMLAGPSEIVILADEKANPVFVAADMLGQAEHDARATAVFITTSEELAEKVKSELVYQMSKLKRKEIIEKSLINSGKIILVDSIDRGVEIINLIAPEHLELNIENPFYLVDSSNPNRIKNAGAIFLGAYSPEALGDYFAGPNHILPTAGAARFSSPLNPDDFVKKSSLIYCTEEKLRRMAGSIKTIAKAERLDAHANSVAVRVDKNE